MDAAAPFTLTRTFDATLDRVWAAWTEPGQLQGWWGPAGCSVSSCTLDLRPGGVFHYGLRMPDGAELWGKWVFREVAPRQRLTFAACFSDAEGGATRHPMAPVWPLHMLSTVAFDDADGQTVLTLTAEPLDATAEECAVFHGAHGSLTQGWGGTFGQFAAYLAATGDAA